MRDFKLNAGGVLGGLVACAGAIAVMIDVIPGWGNERRMTRVVIGATAVGAFLGNVLWRLVFGRPVDGESEESAPPSRPRRPPVETPGVLAANRSCAVCDKPLSDDNPGVTLCGSCRRQTG